MIIRNNVKYINLGLLSVFILLVGYIAFWPVDVLQNWVLEMPGKSFTAGQSINVVSQYDKVREVEGVSHRYVSCDDRRGINVRYEINSARADRTSGLNKGTGVPITFPLIVPDLPAQCRFSISICYDINILKQHCEFNETGFFTLNPESKADTTSSSTNTPTATGGNTNVTTNTSTTTTTTQKESPQPTQPIKPETNETKTVGGIDIGGTRICLPVLLTCKEVEE